MNLTLEKFNLRQLQWLVWLSVAVIIFISYLSMDGLGQSALFTVISTGFYALIIYGNIGLLYPRLYERNQKLLYIAGVVLLLVVAGLGRAYLSWLGYNMLFATKPEPMPGKVPLNYIGSSLLIYMLSFIFRIALAYFSLKKRTEEMLLQKSRTELSLLKAQVQPHFLFNTLNNIYYEAYIEAPRTANLVERLAEIMRYFVDESPKDKVLLATEVQFLENYIALEKIRVLHGVEVIFTTDYPAGLSIPPMLLMTFVENIFKHGVNRAGGGQQITIALLVQNSWLHFTTINALQQESTTMVKTGFGLKNLRQRLTLLYADDFSMEVGETADTFVAKLKIPLP